MAIQTRALNTSYLANNQLLDLLERFENNILVPYDDRATPVAATPGPPPIPGSPGRNPTIGIGMNLRVSTNLALMLDYLGVFSASDHNVPVGETPDQKKARYRAILDDFEAVIAGANLARPNNILAGTHASETQLLTNLNAKLASYSVTQNGQPQTFALDSVGDARDQVRLAILGYAIGPFAGTDELPFDELGAQKHLDDLLVANGTPYDHDTREYMSLMSLYYAVPSLVGIGLKRALAQENRAEAWWEIRYATNEKKLPGVAKRRYVEAEMFGLYDDNTSVDEARDVYRMLQLHRAQVLAYEGRFGVLPNGAVLGQNMIDGQIGANAPKVTGGFELLGTAYEVDTLVESMEPAKAILLADLNSSYGLNLNPANYVSTNIFLDPNRIGDSLASPYDLGHDATIYGSIENEVFIGEAGNDTLVAGDGADVLIGGLHDDVLNGGTGDDLYVFRTGDGKDRIVGDDDNGSILLDGEVLTGAGATLWINPNMDRPGWTWRQDDREFFGTLTTGDVINGGNLLIQHGGLDASDGITIEAWAPGDLGISFATNVAVAMSPGVMAANPHSDPDFVPTTLSTTLPEGLSRSFGIAWNLPASSGQRIRLGVDGLPDKLRVVNGAQTLAFVNGAVELTLREGQSFMTLALLSEGDVDADTTVTLTAILLDANGNSVGAAGDLDVALDAVDEPSPTATFTLDGDLAPDVVDDYFVFDQPISFGYLFGNVLSGTVSPGRADRLLGHNGSDVLNGFGGTDAINGYDGDDVIDGGPGADLLTGGRGADRIFGGDGDDFIMSGASVTPVVTQKASDAEAAPSGNGTVVGDGWNWYLVRGTDGLLGIEAGNGLSDAAGSSFFNDDGGDIVDGGAGNDQIDGGYGDDVARGGEGDDLLLGGPGSDRLEGGSGNDSLFGDVSVKLQATDPDFVVDPADANDLLDGGDGDDLLIGVAGNDTLLGGNGADVLYGDSGGTIVTPLATNGADFLDGGAGNDTLRGGGAADALYGGTGNDTLIGDDVDENAGDDYLNGEDGDDILDGRAGGDTLIGGAGNDQLFGETPAVAPELQGDDLLDGGSGNDTLVGLGGADTLIGGAGNDLLEGDDVSVLNAFHGDDYLDGGDGDDQLFGGGGSDTLYGGAGVDQLVGDDGNLPAAIHGDDYLDGGSGNDLLIGGGGADTLIGGDGDDNLSGDAIDNPASIQLGDYLDGGAGDDQLFGEGGDDVLIGGDGDDLLLGESVATPTAAIGNDYLAGGAGDDQLQGGGGGDTLVGGDDNDLLFGESGNDVLDGGSGNDELQGGDGADALSGGDGNDLMSGGEGDDVLDGGDGADTLFGGAGHDVLSGGAGVDRYVYSFGDGEESIVDSGSNTLRLNFNFAPGGVTLSLGSLQLSFAGHAGDVIHLEGFDVADPLGSAVIDSFEFNNVVMTYSQILALGFDVQGTPQVDLLTGTEMADRISALADNDIVYGLGGNDRLDGGTGADLLFGGTGNDTFVVDQIGDVVVELLNEGTDAVESTAAAYTLSNNVENLTLVGSALNGTGNALANVITGNALGNVLSGLGGNDTLVGGAGNDTLDGGTGADSMDGGDGNDTYIIDNVGDTVTDSSGVELTLASISYALGATEEHLTLTGTASIDGTGNENNNIIIGNSGANRLRGGSGGEDILRGGAGDDVYVIDNVVELQFSTIIENANEGIDRIESKFSYTLPANVENLTLTGTGLIISATGNGLANMLTGNVGDNTLLGLDGNDTLVGGAGNNVLDGGAGADSMEGGADFDIYIVDNAGDTVVDSIDDNDRVEASVSYTPGSSIHIENIVLTGTAALNATGNTFVRSIVGNSAANVLTLNRSGSLSGGGGNDTLNATGVDSHTLDGGAGADTMRGGSSSDTYVVDNVGDVVIDFGSGFDIVRSSAPTYTLTSGVEELDLQAGAGNIDGTGNELANRLVGNESNNHLTGLAGNDTISGLAGDDVIEGGAGNDQLFGSEGNDTISGGADQDTITDYLSARFFDDGQSWVQSGGGINQLAGGAGNDTYEIGSVLSFVNSTSTVVEAPNEGFDGVISHGSFVLGENIEYLVLSEVRDEHSNAVASDGTGNSGDNQIFGTDAANVLSGLGGIDVLDGNAGDDTIFGGDGNDNLFGGTDVVLLGAEGPFYGPLTNADYLDGGAGDDFLDGHSGNDVLLGGDGEDDLYGGDDGAGDQGQHLTNDDQLYGGAGDDALDGGTGDDLLDGGTGIDTMAGGVGNDTYYVDGTFIEEADPAAVDACGNPIEGATHRIWTTDTIQESANQGTDVVFSAATIVLPANFEQVTLVGTDNLDATAGAGGQTLVGNTGNNRLDGGAGADTLRGGAGNDTLVVDVTGDVVEELADGGTDTVVSAIDYTLGTNLENLTLTGTAANGTGNAGANVLRGNAGANTLTGLGGNDELDGAGGNDTLVGGDGDDVYRFGVGSGVDTVIDTVGLNTVRLLGELTAENLTLTQSGDDLIISINGTSDQLILQDWSAVPALQSGNLRLCDCGCPVDMGNDAPVAANDAGSVTEDATLVASGNVLANDTDPDAGDVLSVVDPGTRTGTYGTLVLGASGAYAYTVANATMLVQSLGQGETVTDTFGYTVTDDASSPLADTGDLVVSVHGANDAPTVATPIVDRNGVIDQALQLDVPTASFHDVDRNDALSFTATLANGDALPEWLTLSSPDAATLRFNGTPLTGDAGTYQIRVTATDLFGASTSDVFALAITDGSCPPPTEPPVATGSSVVTEEDTPYVFGWADFGVTDADSAPEDLSVTFSYVNGYGNVQRFDGTEWINAPFWTDISRAEIEAGHVRFNPWENESGFDGYEHEGFGNGQNDYAKVEFAASDGTAGSEWAAVTIDVTPVADAPRVWLEGGGSGTTTTVFETLFDSAPNPNGCATPLAQSTFEGWTLITDAPEDNAGGINVFELWTDGDHQLNGSGETTTVHSVFDNTIYEHEGDSWLELNDAADSNYQTLGIERTVYTIEGAVYTFSLDFAGPLGFSDFYSEIKILVDGEEIGSLKATSPDDHLEWPWGGYSFEFVGTGGEQTLTLLADPCAVTPEGRGAMIDNLWLREHVPNTGMANESIRLQIIYGQLVDQDGSETMTSFIDDIPVGATLSDGTNSFTATEGYTSVEITEWNWGEWCITPPEDFVGEFDLTVRAVATEAVTNDSATTTLPMTVHVLPVPLAPVALDSSITVTEDTPYVITWEDLHITDADSDEESLRVELNWTPTRGTMEFFDGSDWIAAPIWTDIARSEIEAGHLRFVPWHNEAWDGYAEVWYQGSDGALDSEQATITINVTPVADTPHAWLAGAGGGTPTTVFETLFDSASNPNSGATYLAQSTFEGWTLITDAPEDNAGGINVFELWTDGDHQLNGSGETTTVHSVFDNTSYEHEGDSWLELNDAADSNYQALGIERTVNTIEGAVYTFLLDFAGPLGFSDFYSEIKILVDGEQIGSLKASSPDEGLEWPWGGYSFEFVGTGEEQTITLLADPCAVTPEGRGAMIDNLWLREQIPNTGCMNSQIPLQQIYMQLADNDGSESLTQFVDDIPVGATVTDGTTYFTATEGHTSVEITPWQWLIYVIPPEDFYGDFDLTLRTMSTEAGNGDTAADTRPISVHVLNQESPIALDLDGDGVETVALGSTTGTFDLLNTGRPVRSGWLSPDDAFLALDANGNGRIDDRNELFGGAEGEGFAKLAALDSNGDGAIDAADTAYNVLLLWQDRNANHETDAGELGSLAAHGIARLDTAYTVREELQNGNRLLERGRAILDDGSVIDMADAYFTVDAPPAADSRKSIGEIASLNGWTLANALTQFHLDGGAPGCEIGCDYGAADSPDGVGLLVAQRACDSSRAAGATQTLRALQPWQADVAGGL